MNLLGFAALFFVALTSSWYLTRISLAFTLEHKIIDLPNHRSSHRTPTPRGGGFSFVVVFLLAVSVLGAAHFLRPLETIGLLGGVLIAVIGCWDDYVDLSIRIRLLVQFAAAAGAIFCLIGFRYFQALGNMVLALGAVLLVFLALIWLINLTNFMDGIDGLAGVEAVTVASLCSLLSIMTHGINTVALLYAVLAASATGFLIWNWYPAKIFMGDVGSGFIGYCFGALTLLAFFRRDLSLFVPPILLGVFVIDASVTLGKRLLRGGAWYAPHRTHAYQHLAQRYGHERTSLWVAIVNLFWLAPWAALAQWHPAHSLLWLASAWSPLIVAAHVLRAGETLGPWKGIDQHLTPQLQVPRLLEASSLSRTGASTITRIYRFMEKNGFVAKHTLLLFLNYECVYLAFLTRFDGAIPSLWIKSLPVIALLWSLCQGCVLLLFRFSRSHWRFTSAEEIPPMTGVSILGSITGAIVVTLCLHAHRFPRPLPPSLYLLDALYAVSVLAGIRLGSRLLYGIAPRTAQNNERKRVLIYGADGTGISVLSELRRQRDAYRAIGFLDDREEIRGESVSGLPVLGNEIELARLAKKHRIQQILVPSLPLSEERRQYLTKVCNDENLDLRIVAILADDIQIRRPKAVPDLIMEDLLGRKPIKLDTTNIAAKIEGQTVMVTGAAGSIGSELCRQIARFKPRAIIGYEISETALFFMERQMQELFPSVSFVPCIGSVQNRARLDDVLRTHRPQSAYHAAAYKHVPLMEQHIFEVIENNIFGTQTLLSACQDHGVGNFVMISTDKAARPTSLMGVSKRVAEILVRGSCFPDLTCVSTRFGNVLGSNGSVIPIFREQIARGGPVTITHPAMVRFFMTIPEAAQLVLQASTLGSSNEIFVLDMGSPVKIVDLAERMINLAGLIPGKDIAIEFTGIRPGEKLYEELSTSGEELLPTSHESVSVFRSGVGLSSSELALEMDRLRSALEQRSVRGALEVLEFIVPDYTASREIRALGAQLNQLPAVLHVAYSS
jgi:FlaA1/EpsC-like NDP-sugar epimerase/UDP-N-acetylmuramyl pentapeptide phosphotransferase/UDP-N-acetylglucosamine-1-phosphate transferase